MASIYTCDGCGVVIESMLSSTRLDTPSTQPGSKPWQTTHLMFHSFECLQRWVKNQSDANPEEGQSDEQATTR